MEQQKQIQPQQNVSDLSYDIPGVSSDDINKTYKGNDHSTSENRHNLGGIAKDYVKYTTDNAKSAGKQVENATGHIVSGATELVKGLHSVLGAIPGVNIAVAALDKGAKLGTSYLKQGATNFVPSIKVTIKAVTDGLTGNSEKQRESVPLHPKHVGIGLGSENPLFEMNANSASSKTISKDDGPEL